MNRRLLAILAAIGATTIYGINHTIAKGIMPHYVQPFGFIILRVLGAAILFWLISPLGPKERIDPKDYRRLFFCALLGMATNMLAFFKGLSLSTPINSSVLITTTPIIVLILSAVFSKEKISRRKILGISIGLLGALGLILLSEEVRQDAPNIPLGNFLIFMNSMFYGSYLVLVKVLITKYHPFTFMKWLFSLGVLICLPFGFNEFTQISWSTLPSEAYFGITYVILGTTFCTYLFNIFALSQLKASTVSAFGYMQPLVGITYAVFTGQDSITTIKIIAASFILMGVYLSSKKPKKKLQEG